MRLKDWRKANGTSNEHQLTCVYCVLGRNLAASTCWCECVRWVKTRAWKWCWYHSFDRRLAPCLLGNHASGSLCCAEHLEDCHPVRKKEQRSHDLIDLLVRKSKNPFSQYLIHCRQIIQDRLHLVVMDTWALIFAEDEMLHEHKHAWANRYQRCDVGTFHVFYKWQEACVNIFLV